MFCQDCNKRSECKKICPELEKILPKPTTGRPAKQILLSSDLIDRTFYKDKYGEVKSIKELNKRIMPHIENDGAEE